MKTSEDWMRKAVQAARLGLIAKDDRPFGCVIIDAYSNLLSVTWGTGRNSNPLRHSECRAITEACNRRHGLLYGCTLFSTHEPCHMCAGATLHSHVAAVYWGTYRADMPSLFRDYEVPTADILRDSSHPPLVAGGILREECLTLFASELAEAECRS